MSYFRGVRGPLTFRWHRLACRLELCLRLKRLDGDSAAATEAEHAPSTNLLGGGGLSVLALAAAGAAGDEDQDGGNEEGNDGADNAPDTGTVRGRQTAGIVGVVVDDGHAGEVGGENDNGDDEGKTREDRGEERLEGAGTDGGEQEADEGQDAGDGVQDHDAGQSLGGVLASAGDVDVGVKVAAKDVGGVVANHLLAAVQGTTANTC